MRKLLAYYGLIDGRNITPTEQDNFGRNVFLIGLITPIILTILFLLGVFDK